MVSDSNGERLAGGMKPGVLTVGPQRSETRFQMQAFLTLKMSEDYEKENGRLYYSAVRWDKIVAVSFLLSPDSAAIITISGDTPLQEVFNIENLIREWKATHLA